MIGGLPTYYTILTGILFLVWISIYALKKELRRELLVLGIFSLFLMPFLFTLNNIDVSEVQIGFRTLSIIDLFFAFSLSGIAGTIFHSLFGKHYHKLPKSEKKKLHQHEESAQTWILRFFLTFLGFSWGTVLLTGIFSIPLPYAFLISAIIVATYILSHRHDLLEDAIWSSILTSFIVFLASTLASLFTGIDFSIAPIVSSATILGTPADLLLWSLAAGLALGPLYEYIRTLDLK